MSCSTCSESIINDTCGCGCSTCKPFITKPDCYHCPPPPPIPPCGMRVCGTESIPVWNTSHPLIPMFRTSFPEVLRDGCEEEMSDTHLATILSAIEPVFSTCQFPGEEYYQAVMLRTAALLEYQIDITQWRSARTAMMMMGKNFNAPKPTLDDGIYGQLLKELMESHQLGKFSLVV